MITGTQVRMARAGLGMRVTDLASAAAVSPAAVTRLEAGMGADPGTMATVRAALEAAGATFLDETPEGFGVRVRGGGPAGADDGRLLRPDELNSSNDD